MTDDNFIKCNNINYAIYKIGNWKNNYKINIIGTSNEIPVTNPTKEHVLKNMEQIRLSEFNISGKQVNGMLGLAIQLNPSLNNENIDDLIKIEQEEFDLISKEIADLDLKNDEDIIFIDSEEFLIYKLEFEGHSLSSKPANDFTKKHHMDEIKRLKNISGN